LFESKSDELLWVQLWNENELCNYRCSYCFLDHRDKVDNTKIARFGDILDRLHLIPRPLAVHMGARGEVLTLPDLWPLYAKLAALPNLRFAEFWSNLSRPLDGVLKHISPSKLNIVATFHPTQYKRPAEKTAFFDRVKFLRDNANDVVLHFVHSPDNAPFIPEIIKTAKEMGVHLLIKPLVAKRNAQTGEAYPAAYQHRDILKLRKWFGSDLAVHFAFEHPINVRCGAGKDFIHIRHDGSVSRCEFSNPLPEQQKYGNILDEGGPTIDTVSRYCWRGGCGCYDIMGHSEPFVAEYRREKCSVRFIRRAPGEIGTRSYD
jgi:MoaA/NifB/PqqE/SkfB family radical SAM enzyme